MITFVPRIILKQIWYGEFILDEHYFLYEVTIEAVVGICLQREVCKYSRTPPHTENMIVVEITAKSRHIY